MFKQITEYFEPALKSRLNAAPSPLLIFFEIISDPPLVKPLSSPLFINFLSFFSEENKVLLRHSKF